MSLKDEVVADIEERIAAWTFLPRGKLPILVSHGYLPIFELRISNLFIFLLPENGEAIQILRYEHGQKYEPHFDYFHDKANQELGGHRVATVLMYLSDVEKGGETVFPDAEVSNL